MDDKAGYSDAELLWMLTTIDDRSPEQIEADEFWITKTAQEIIQRRKDRQLSEEAKECQD